MCYTELCKLIYLWCSSRWALHQSVVHSFWVFPYLIPICTVLHRYYIKDIYVTIRHNDSAICCVLINNIIIIRMTLCNENQVIRVNTLNDGVQSNKVMTVTNQNHLRKELKRGEGNSPFTSGSVFHIFMDGCFLF